MSKQKLEEILTLNNEQFRLVAINNKYGIIQLSYTGNITFNYDISNKEEIYVGITKILNNMTDEGTPIAFETNISSIQNLNSYIFEDNEGKCYFKKNKVDPLILLCLYKSGYSSQNKKSENEIVLVNIHYKYNFRIQPYDLNTSIVVSNYETSVYQVYPEELNFVSENFVNMGFIMKDGIYFLNIALFYPDSISYVNIPSLNCEKLIGVKICKIPIFHFIKQNYKENNISYIYHSSSKNNIKIDYGLPPIKISLPNNIIKIPIAVEENSNTKVVCSNFKIYLITDYDDSNNIFDASNIEEKTSFNTTIRLDTNYEQMLNNINCRLWKSKNRNLIIICQTNFNINVGEDFNAKGHITETTFNYNDYKVAIVSDAVLSLYIQNKNCSFLYADEQIINVMENDEFYDLNFKMDIYNNESLFLSNMERNYIQLNKRK